MSLAPEWAKAAAVLGLRMQLLQLRIAAAGIDPVPFLPSHLEELDRRIDEIEAMKK